MRGVGADEGGELGGDGDDDFARPHAPAEKRRGEESLLEIGPDELAVGEIDGLAKLREVHHTQEGEGVEEDENNAGHRAGRRQNQKLALDDEDAETGQQRQSERRARR
jgi:hypothetical protein